MEDISKEYPEYPGVKITRLDNGLIQIKEDNMTFTMNPYMFEKWKAERKNTLGDVLRKAAIWESELEERKRHRGDSGI